MNPEVRPDDTPEKAQPTRCWVRRTETIAAFVLATLFFAWVATICVQQRLTGRDIEVVKDVTESSQYRVNLNEADKGELMLLPGIGDVRSNRILTWRREQGRFQSLDDVKDATGLSDNAIDVIRDLVMFGDTQGE